uniref:glutaminase A n=1 Tax=uncultured Tessaracoccus sp. TaxID=905023 RepID=UPI002604127F
PELSNVNPNRLAVAVCMGDGTVYGAGDADVEFTIQSMSKPFVYALALRDQGLEATQQKVGVEPSGDAFNDLSLSDDGRPQNPMINAGAMAVHALIGGPQAPLRERTEMIIDGLSRFAGRQLTVDEDVYASEFATAFRNRAIANMLRNVGVIEQDPRDIVGEYTRQCATKVTTKDLATMAVTLAMGGRNPVTGEQVVPAWVCRYVLSVMMTCGMYDAAGDWMTTVGIPAKSGVSGGVFGALPGQAGLAAFSPKVDSHGHSVRGVRVFGHLSRDLNLHLMEVQEARVRLLESSREVELRDGLARHLRLRGALYFGSVERLLRELADIPDEHTVVVDLSDVTHINPIGRRMLLDAMEQLGGAGERRLVLVDPASRLRDPEGTGVEMDVVKKIDEER